MKCLGFIFIWFFLGSLSAELLSNLSPIYEEVFWGIWMTGMLALILLLKRIILIRDNGDLN